MDPLIQYAHRLKPRVGRGALITFENSRYPRKKWNKPEPARFARMSKEAQQVVVEMVEYRLHDGACMGQDEGLRRDGEPRAFRQHLEEFAGGGG